MYIGTHDNVRPSASGHSLGKGNPIIAGGLTMYYLLFIFSFLGAEISECKRGKVVSHLASLSFGLLLQARRPQ